MDKLRNRLVALEGQTTAEEVVVVVSQAPLAWPEEERIAAIRRLVAERGIAEQFRIDLSDGVEPKILLALTRAELAEALRLINGKTRSL